MVVDCKANYYVERNKTIAKTITEIVKEPTGAREPRKNYTSKRIARNLVLMYFSYKYNATFPLFNRYFTMRIFRCTELDRTYCAYVSCARRRRSTAIIVHRPRTHPYAIRKTSIGFAWHLLMRLVTSFSDRYKLNCIRTAALMRFHSINSIPSARLALPGYRYPAKSQIHWSTTVIRFRLRSRSARGEEKRKPNRPKSNKRKRTTVLRGSENKR